MALRATLHVAVPLVTKAVPEKDLPSSQSVLASNGGIQIARVQGEWFGDSHSWRSDPSSGARGVRGILNFEKGRAPVTVSRNTLKIAEGDAKSVIAGIQEAVTAAWTAYARDLWDQPESDLTKTARLQRVLANSAYPPDTDTYQKHNWAKSDDLAESAVALIRAHGVAEVITDEGDTVSREVRAIGELLDGQGQVLVVHEAVTKGGIRPLLRDQLGARLAVISRNTRELALLASCGQRWRSVRAERDLWTDIDLLERRDSKIRRYMSPEMAIVDSRVFPEQGSFARRLPVTRAQVTKIAGMTRADSEVPPRMILNSDHPVILAIEARLSAGQVDETALEMTLAQLMTLADEKAQGRLRASVKSVRRALLSLSDLPPETPLSIEV